MQLFDILAFGCHTPPRKVSRGAYGFIINGIGFLTLFPVKDKQSIGNPAIMICSKRLVTRILGKIWINISFCQRNRKQ